jgi:hypothetical protein
MALYLLLDGMLLVGMISLLAQAVSCLVTLLEYSLIVMIKHLCR